MSKKSFVGGAAILAVAGLISKFIGVFYRIPLNNIIGEQGMGIYQEVYPVYALLLTVSTAGIPTAISKLVSSRCAKGQYAAAHRVFKVSIILLVVIGAILAAIVYFASDSIASGIIGDPLASDAFRSIAPGVFFVACLSAFRGYFQGKQVMSPTALSQLMEQIGKLIMGLALAVAWLPMGVQWGAAGTLLGVSLSELAALLLLLGIFVFTRRNRNQDIERSIERFGRQREGFGFLSKEIALIAIPVTIGGAIMPLMGFIDSALIVNILQDVGYKLAEARSLFGLLTGTVNTLVSMPSVLTIALQMALVPAISHAKAKRDKETIRISAQVGTKLAIYLGLPCAVGLYVLAQPIISCLYSNLQPSSITTAAMLLQQMAPAIIFLALVQTLTGVLQGMGRVYIPVLHLGVGAIVKVILSLVLIRIPTINISGAVIGTIACYVIASGLNLWQVKMRTNMKFNLLDFVVKPVVASGIMGVVAYYLHAFALPIAGRWVALGLGIAGGVVVFLIVIILLKGIGPEDLEMIPGGSKIQKLLDKRER